MIAKSMRTRSEDRPLARVYLKKAGDNVEAMAAAFPHRYISQRLIKMSSFR